MTQANKPSRWRRLFTHGSHGLLVVVACAGGWKALQLQAQVTAVRGEVDELSEELGDLEIVDRSAIHIRALPSHDPLHFLWRIYLPEKSKVATAFEVGTSSSGSSGWSADGGQFIAQVRIYKRYDGLPVVYYQWQNGSGMSSFNSDKVLEFLKTHYQKLRIEVAGREKTLVVNPGKPITVLKIEIPPELIAEEPSLVNDRELSRIKPTVLQFQMK